MATFDFPGPHEQGGKQLATQLPVNPKTADTNLKSEENKNILPVPYAAQIEGLPMHKSSVHVRIQY